MINYYHHKIFNIPSKDVKAYFQSRKLGKEVVYNRNKFGAIYPFDFQPITYSVLLSFFKSSKLNVV